MSRRRRYSLSYVTVRFQVPVPVPLCEVLGSTSYFDASQKGKANSEYTHPETESVTAREHVTRGLGGSLLDRASAILRYNVLAAGIVTKLREPHRLSLYDYHI